MKTFLCVLKVVSIIFFIFSVIALLCVYLDFQILSINNRNFKGTIGASESYYPIFIAFFSLVTLYVASSQLNNYIEVERIRSIVELRGLLYQDSNRDVHRLISVIRGQDREAFGKVDKNSLDKLCFSEISDKTEADSYLNKILKNCDDVAVDNYLGTLEVAYIMYSKGVLDLDVFKRLFGYRIAEIFEDVHGGDENANHKLLRNYINKYKSDYENLFKAYQLIK